MLANGFHDRFDPFASNLGTRYERNKLSLDSSSRLVYNSSSRCVNDDRDLGVTLSFNLSFAIHVVEIPSNALKTFGSAGGASRHFQDINTIELLYCSLVRPRVEYCVTIRSPYRRYLQVYSIDFHARLAFNYLGQLYF